MAMALPRMAMAQQHQQRTGMEMADLEYAYELQMEEAIAASMRQGNQGELEEIGAQERIHDKQEVVVRGDASGPPPSQNDAEDEVAEEEEEDEDGSVFNCDQEYGIQVRAMKTPEGHVGIGVLLTDPGLEARVLWKQSRYAGQGLSWHVAEYGGLLEAMEVAERLGVQYLCVRVSSRVVSDQVREPIHII